MSGFKKVTVTIGEQEYQRLVEAENRLRFHQASQAKKRNQSVEKSIQNLYDEMNEMDNRQAQFIQAVSQLDQTIQQVEVDSAAQILEQANTFICDLEAYKDAFVETTQELVAQQGEFYQQAILQEHADRQQAMLRVQRRLNQTRQNENQKRETAQVWIDTCSQIVRFIQENYRANLIPPGQLEQITQELLLARQNLGGNILDGAILGAQQAYHRLSRLRVDLERQSQEFTSLQHAASCALETLASQEDQAAFYPAIDLDGNEIEELIPVDQWTGGKLSELRHTTAETYAVVADESGTLTLEALRQMLHATLPQLQEQLVKVIHEARRAALSSQVRINIAEIIVHALEGQGFALVNSQYEHNEMQNPFKARLSALDGSKVTIRVVPSAQDIASNEVYLKNQDTEERTDHELKQRAGEIMRSLKDYGLTVKNIQVLSSADTDSKGGYTPLPERRVQAGSKPR